jgi:hypothetical protein
MGSFLAGFTVLKLGLMESGIVRIGFVGNCKHKSVWFVVNVWTVLEAGSRHGSGEAVPAEKSGQLVLYVEWDRSSQK